MGRASNEAARGKLKPLLDRLDEAYGQQRINAACLDLLGYPAAMVTEAAELTKVETSLKGKGKL